MPLVMQLALPLGLHLRSPITENVLTREYWRPGEKFDNGRSLRDLAFLDNYSGRGKATTIFAVVLRAIYNHPDWSQLHAFFSTRYSESQMDIDPAIRTLHPFKDTTAATSLQSSLVPFRTDLESVDLPKDLPALLGEAALASRARMLGPDPQSAAIGPAISLACGAGAYIDLVYAGRPPGEYPQPMMRSDLLHERGSGEYQALAPSISEPSAPKRGGRDRYWAEWAELWKVIADWVYEHESSAIQLGFISHHGYKYKPNQEEASLLDRRGKTRRAYLETDAIGAADAVRDVFVQIAENPLRFQGIEWGFLELAVPAPLKEAFYRRFGKPSFDAANSRSEADIERRYTELLRRVGGHGREIGYEHVSPPALKRCPDGFRGEAWEAWFLGIEGGDVVVVETIFQALWALSLLLQLPLNIRILDWGTQAPRCRDPLDVYL